MSSFCPVCKNQKDGLYCEICAEQKRRRLDKIQKVQETKRYLEFTFVEEKLRKEQKVATEQMELAHNAGNGESKRIVNKLDQVTMFRLGQWLLTKVDEFEAKKLTTNQIADIITKEFNIKCLDTNVDALYRMIVRPIPRRKFKKTRDERFEMLVKLTCEIARELGKEVPEGLEE